MKARSITAIGKILKEKEETAEKAYRAIRNNLEEKYDTGWLDQVMTEEEKEMLKNAKNNYNDMREIVEDFERHQW